MKYINKIVYNYRIPIEISKLIYYEKNVIAY